MTKNTAWGPCEDVTQHIRGVSTVKNNVATGLVISPVFARENLRAETLMAATVHNGVYCFIEGDHLKPLADSKKVREAVLSSKITLGYSLEEIENDVIKELSIIDPEFLVEIGIEPNTQSLIKKDYENRVRMGCSDTVIASSGEHETLITGVIKVYTADGLAHLVKKHSFEKILDTEGKKDELRLKDLELAFLEGEPPIKSRINKYIVDSAFKLMKNFNESDNPGDLKHLFKVRHEFNRVITAIKDSYVTALEESGLTWGEAILSFCDEAVEIRKQLPKELKGSSILG